MLNKKVQAEIEDRADFSYIRYSQCWEDTNVVLKALEISSTDRCLSIASAGDNSLSLLAKAPQKVIAIDLNKSQLALLELKVLAIKRLKRFEVLELLGYLTSTQRIELYNQIKGELHNETRNYFDSNLDILLNGLSEAGKFEKYFKYFRQIVLPLVHSKKTVAELVETKSEDQRKEFYDKRWNTTRWKIMLQLFFSNQVMGLLGRDKEFFKYAKRSLPEFLNQSIYNALVIQDPSKNPYLHWILFGHYKNVLPHWLEEDTYYLIKENIEKLEIKQQSLEEFLNDSTVPMIDCWNLSDIFEYMSGSNYEKLLEQIARCSNPGARIAYWNMLVPRSVKDTGNKSIIQNSTKSKDLYALNQTFFYTRFHLEVVC